MKTVHQRQYLDMVLAHFKIHGADVSSSTAGSAGLLKGSHIGTVIKAANQLTFVLAKPLGLIPGVFFQARTLDCAIRLNTDPTLNTIVVNTFLNSNLSTPLNDADFEMFLVGTEGIYEGRY